MRQHDHNAYMAALALRQWAQAQRRRATDKANGALILFALGVALIVLFALMAMANGWIPGNGAASVEIHTQSKIVTLENKWTKP